MANTPVPKAGSGSEIYGLSGEDRLILKRMIEDFRNQRSNLSTPLLREPVVETLDYLAPEIYLASDAALTDTGTGTGTGTETSTEETEESTTLTDMDVYKIDQIQSDPKIISAGFVKQVYDPGTRKIIARDKFGQWILLTPGIGLVELCLAEDHPGRGIPFSATLGIWNPDSNCWDYCGSAVGTAGHVDSGTADDAGTTRTSVKAIDWRYGTPYPEAGARGLFIARSSTEYGTIYECVSLDCESPGDCCVDEETGTATS